MRVARKVASNKKTTAKSKSTKATNNAKSPKAKKKMPGKNPTSLERRYLTKPMLWLENGQVPESLKEIKPGQKVQLTVDAVVEAKTERANKNDSMTILIDSLAVAGNNAKAANTKQSQKAQVK